MSSYIPNLSTKYFHKGQRLKLTTSTPFTPTYVQSQLTTSSDPSAVYASRVQNRQIALENPARESRSKQLADQRKARQAQDAARRKSRVLSRKDAVLKGVWDLKKEETRHVFISHFVHDDQLNYGQL